MLDLEGSEKRAASKDASMGPKKAIQLIAEAKRAYLESRESCLLRRSRAHANFYTNITIRDGNHPDGRRRYLAVLAHRFIYEKVIGPIPQGRWVLHHCDVRGCVNPCHLFLGDAEANSWDMVVKDRHGRGERQKVAKIKDADVVQIRELAKTGMLYKDIGAKFGLKAPQTGAIIRRQAWKHIT
jgi:hypothetical protein